MRTIIGSSGRDCVLIKTELFEVNYFWVGHHDHSLSPPALPVPQSLYWKKN